jgi:hypothetical protein
VTGEEGDARPGHTVCPCGVPAPSLQSPLLSAARLLLRPAAEVHVTSRPGPGTGAAAHGTVRGQVQSMRRSTRLMTPSACHCPPEPCRPAVPFSFLCCHVPPRRAVKSESNRTTSPRRPGKSFGQCLFGWVMPWVPGSFETRKVLGSAEALTFHSHSSSLLSKSQIGLV